MKSLYYFNNYKIYFSIVNSKLLAVGPYFIVSFLILVFNLVPILKLDGLLQDDQYYYNVFYNELFSENMFRRNFIQSLFSRFIINIAAHQSIYLARFLIVLFLNIPSAVILFYFFSRKLNLPIYASITIAVLPFILPNELDVPAYVIGSYMHVSLLFSLISVFFMLKGRDIKNSLLYLVLSCFFFYLAVNSSELVAILLPLLLFLLFFSNKILFRNIIASFVLLSIAIHKSFTIARNPWGNINNPFNELTDAVIRHRITHFIDFINPFYGIGHITFMNILVLLIIFLALSLSLYKIKYLTRILSCKHNFLINRPKHWLIMLYFVLPFLLFAISSLPFLFKSQNFTSRYFLFSSIGFLFLIIISLLIVIHLCGKYYKYLYMILLTSIIFWAGYTRADNFIAKYKNVQLQFKSLNTLIANFDFPENSQIIIVSDKKVALGTGVTDKSVGCFNFVLNRRDVNGLIMEELNYYNPFRLSANPWRNRFAGIDTTKVTFFFRGFNLKPEYDKQFFYALKWDNENSGSSPWTIYNISEEGIFNRFLSGYGFDEYVKNVDSLTYLGLSFDEILFGRVPTKIDSLRLGL